MEKDIRLRDTPGGYIHGVTQEAIFEGLNDQQRLAVEAVTGPVAILAGAGSGKTTTITRRIANQVASGTFTANSILAVTFTDKAAGEMRQRLAALGVDGVRARTFHSAALRQLVHFRPGTVGDILSSKAKILGPMIRALPPPYKFTPIADFASEIEWAKNQRIRPDDYLDRIVDHDPPADPKVMQQLYSRYEARKEKTGAIDFEDMLELTIGMFDEDEEIRHIFYSRYRGFTVDEYQDVNLLQQTVLERWLGERDDLCVVGDDYQAIYSFTGASPSHLLSMADRFERAKVFRLEDNYRSTPEVLEVANRLVPLLGGARKVLRPVREPAAAPVLRSFESGDDERAFLIAAIRRLHADEGVAYEDMAILYRINAKSEAWEDALAGAGIPYQVRDDPFLLRPAARQLLPRLQRERTTELADTVDRIATALGYDLDATPSAGRQEYTRQKDFARLIRIAEEFEDGVKTAADLVAELTDRFSGDRTIGVNLLTLHRSKGLEFDAVFLPALERGELPHKRADIDEERRLLYVGLTRAKRFLHMTWVANGKRKPSAFVTELTGEVQPSIKKATVQLPPEDQELKDALKSWRLTRSRDDGVPAYVVFHDATLDEIAKRKPKSLMELRDVPGLGPTKCDRYGDAVLELVSRAAG